MIIFVLCVLIYIASAIFVYRDIRKTYWSFLIDDTPTTFGEWVVTLLPIVNTITFIYTEYIKFRNRKWINKN